MVTETKKYHHVLANYFKVCSTSKNGIQWHEKRRELAELPFQLMRANRPNELEELLSSLSYLIARVGVGAIYQLIADYSFLGKGFSPETTDWLSFLIKQSQRLELRPRMLIALINHEGFSSSRAQLDAIEYLYPWIKTKPEAKPPSAIPSTTGLRTTVLRSFNSLPSRISALALNRELVFYLEGRNVIRVLDVREMSKLDTALNIVDDRPLNIVSSPDAKSLSVFFESGDVVVYRCIFANEKPVMLETIARTKFKLPAIEDPTAAWYDGAIWFQSPKDQLISIDTESGEIKEEIFYDTANSELAAIVFTDTAFLVAFRHTADIVLIRNGANQVLCRNTDIVSSTLCYADIVAIAFTDGSIVLYDIANDIKQIAKVTTGMVCGNCGWGGDRLLWLESDNGFQSWLPSESKPISVVENGEIFPPRLDASPRQWLALPNKEILLLTNHDVLSFRLTSGEDKMKRTLDSFFGGEVWRIVWREARNHWLTEGIPLRENLLGFELSGQLSCALDGQGHFFFCAADGQAAMINLSTFQEIPISNFPSLINAAAGDVNGGCWFVDRTGSIYYTSTEGHCKYVALIDLPDIKGFRIQICDQFVVCWGLSSGWFPETGTEWARTFIFYKQKQTDQPYLDFVGKQVLAPKEGICIAVHANTVGDELITLWEIEGRTGYRLRIGNIAEFIEWRVHEFDLLELPPMRIEKSALSIDGTYLALLSITGELSCLRVNDGKLVATLASSIPFIAIAASRDRGFWAVNRDDQVYHCKLELPK